MVRPRAENYEERRQSLLDAAAAMFAERGFDGASMSQIARQCGVSKALLYHYYQSKEELLYSMLSSHCYLLLRTAEEALAGTEEKVSQGSSSARERLHALIRALMRLYMESRDKHVVLLNSLHCLPDKQQVEIKQLERNLVGLIKDLLSELKPGIDESLRSSLAMYLMGAINWTYTWFRPDGPVSQEEYARMATGVFLDGIESQELSSFVGAGEA